MRFSRVILLLKLCMKVAFSSFRGTNHRKVLFWEGQQATKSDPNFWVAGRARSLARQDRRRDQLTPRCHRSENSFPSWASVPCCCQNHPVSGHSAQLQGWSRWKRSSDRAQPASSRNACCLGSAIIVLVYAHSSRPQNRVSTSKVQVLPNAVTRLSLERQDASY